MNYHRQIYADPRQKTLVCGWWFLASRWLQTFCLSTELIFPLQYTCRQTWQETMVSLQRASSHLCHHYKSFFNTLKPRQNGCNFADDTFNCIFVNENVRISIEFSLKFVYKGPINNIPALVQIMAWRRPGDMPLSEPVMVSLLTHICVTRPRWAIYDIRSEKQQEITLLYITAHEFVRGPFRKW